MKTSPSTFLVLGLGGRILANNYLSAFNSTSLNGFFVGALVFWIAERYYPTSQVALSLAGILALRIFIDSLTKHDARLVFWTLIGFCFSGVCTVSSVALLRKYKEMCSRIPKDTRSRQEAPESVADEPPSYDSLTHPVPRRSYRWQTPALSRMLEEVLQVMDNVNQSLEAPPDPPPPAVIDNTSSSSSNAVPSAPACVACGDPISSPAVTLRCKHTYDINCVVDMFLANLTSSVFPPLCCKRAIPVELIEKHVSIDVLEMMHAKERELATPNRLYCSNPTCSKFLGPRQRPDNTNTYSPPSSNTEFNNSIFPDTVTCPSCTTQTCRLCGGSGHKGGAKRCTVDKALKKALLLGQAHGWQRCPQCRAVVERTSGCKHISCVCGAHFCYGCGGLMSACVCAKNGKRKDYLLRDELALAAAKAGSAAGKVKVGSTFVGICKKSWGGVKGVLGGRRR